MASYVRSDVLHIASGVSLAVSAPYVAEVVPAGERWIVKEVSIYNPTAGAVVLAFNIRRGLLNAAIRNASTPSRRSAFWTAMELVVDAGDELLVYVDSAVIGMTVYVAGSRLDVT